MTEQLKDAKLKTIEKHVLELNACKLCPEMVGPVVSHHAMLSKVMLVGQAPGPKEGEFGKPFAWTAGKTLFRWFGSIGVSEDSFRQKAYMAAVCRCFPGKTKHGGDRVPSKLEVKNCSAWIESEFEILDPDLIIPVGRLAIDQFLKYSKLTDVIGKVHQETIHGRTRDIIPLPHPSGASTWFKRDPGKSLTLEALALVKEHKSWKQLFD